MSVSTRVGLRMYSFIFVSMGALAAYEWHCGDGSAAAFPWGQMGACIAAPLAFTESLKLCFWSTGAASSWTTGVLTVACNCAYLLWLALKLEFTPAQLATHARRMLVEAPKLLYDSMVRHASAGHTNSEQQPGSSSAEEEQGRSNTGKLHSA